MRNADLTPAQKLVALATINEAGWRHSAGSAAPYTVNETRVAAAAGVTPQTVSTPYRALCGEGGVFAKNTTRAYDPARGWYSTVNLTPRAEGGVVGLLKAAASCTPERPEKPPGKERPACVDHPFADVVRRYSDVCTTCGTVLDQHDVRLKSKFLCSDGAQDLETVTDEFLKSDVRADWEAPLLRTSDDDFWSSAGQT